MTLLARNWKTFWYWRKVKLRQREARLEHVEVGVQRARVDAVGGERALEAPQGRRHAAQRVRASRSARCPRRRRRRAAARRGSRRGTTGPGRRSAARCSCRRSTGCRRRCGASGRCSRSPSARRGLRMMALSSSSTVRQASSSASRVRRPGRACQRASAASKRCRVRRVELEVAGDGRADVVGRQRVLAREQLVRAHQERDAAPARAAAGERSPPSPLGRPARGGPEARPARARSGAVERRRSGPSPPSPRRARRGRRAGPAAHLRSSRIGVQRVGRDVRLEAGRVEREPVAQHLRG